MTRKLTLYIAASADGFIAAPNDDLSFLNSVELPGEDYGYNAFMATVDTVLLGRKTYDKVRSMGVDQPHADKECYVITRTPRENIGTTTFYSGDLAALVQKLKGEPGKRIFCDGGGEIIDELLHADMIDEIIVSVIPVILGSGTPLFKPGRTQQSLKLITAQSFASGLVQLHYEVIR